MSEDRTQAPTKRRRQLARERGQAAQSPELTGAAALLGAALALSAWGDGLAATLLALLGEPLSGDTIAVAADAAEVVARLRHLALAVSWPLLSVLGGAFLAALAAHQAQVRGLWAPALLAPDPSRLWAPGQGPGVSSRAGRGLWALAKAVVVAAVAAWALRADWSRLQQLGRLDAPDLARASAAALRHLTLTLAAATLALGLADFAMQHFRFEAMLRLTPEEHREDLRATEGDPALRARRRRASQAIRGGSGEGLVGASVVLTGPAGLTVVLAGGPPPRAVAVRAIVTGPPGDRLRQLAAQKRLPLVDAPDLARRLARRRPPSLPPTGDLLDELTVIWPA
jgi:flagellar biosynthetic protein FlhB